MIELCFCKTFRGSWAHWWTCVDAFMQPHLGPHIGQWCIDALSKALVDSWDAKDEISPCCAHGANGKMGHRHYVF